MLPKPSGFTIGVAVTKRRPTNLNLSKFAVYSNEAKGLIFFKNIVSFEKS
jgi:hypothetical protein